MRPQHNFFIITNPKLGILLIIACLILAAYYAAQKETLPAQNLPLEVINVLEMRCASCHGVDQHNYAEFIAQEREKFFYFPINTQGKLTNNKLTYKVTTGDERINFHEPARFSPLLRYPLAAEYGGLPHKGLDIFYSTNDSDYQILHNWVATKTSPIQLSLSKAQLAFKNDVQPALIRNGCFLSSCHGPISFTDFKMTPPMPDGVFSAKMTESNRLASLGTVTKLVNLGGDLKRSRLLVKNIPIKNGGVHQRGGNNQFFEGFNDPDVLKIINWMELERKDLAAKLTIAGKPVTTKDLTGKSKGIIFIRGPKHQPRQFFDFESFYPGSNIFLYANNKEIQLTQYKNAEIQALDISYDAQKVVFSMRESKAMGFRLYELNLASKAITLLTDNNQPNERLVHHIDPIYTPGYTNNNSLSDVTITYASNHANEYVASQPWGIIGEADSSSSLGVVIDKQRHEQAGTYTGRRVYFSNGPNKGQWRTIVTHTKNTLILNKKLPNIVNENTIYSIEEFNSGYTSSFDIWQFSPGEFAKSNTRLTWGFSQERKPTMRTSGEIMMTSVRNLGYQDHKPVFNGAIYRVQAGGFDFHPHGGERSQYALISDSREMPEGLEVKLLHDPRNYWGGGQLALADHGQGASTEANNPTDGIPLTTNYNEVPFSSFPRNIAEIITLNPNINHTGVSDGGAYKDPYPTPDGRILTAMTVDPLDHLNPDADPNWDIYWLEFITSPHNENHRIAGEFITHKVNAISTELAEYNPRPLVVRLQEKRQRPIDHQKFIKGSSPIKQFGVKYMPEGTPAELEIYDVPLLASFLTNFTQTGNRAISEHGKIKYVRVIAVLPLTKDELQHTNSPDPYATRVSLGVHTKKMIISEVALFPDESIYLELPPNKSLILQTLDEKKRALFTLQRMIYTQPGEKFTMSIPRTIFPSICGGCHGSLTSRAADSIGPIDITTAASQVMATWNNKEQKRRLPSAKNASKSDYIAIDFMRDVQPILSKYCSSCHQSHELDLRADKTLFYNIAYESLHQLKNPGNGNFADKKFINERESLSSDSLLIHKLLSKEHNYLNSQELLTLIRWIDLGATFKGAIK